jgi:hypothetical protein
MAPLESRDIPGEPFLLCGTQMIRTDLRFGQRRGGAARRLSAAHAH